MTTASETLGYEQRRHELADYVDVHYIARFGLTPCAMLDAGCGDGFWSDLFARRGFAVHGVDQDQEAIHVARRRCMHGFADNAYPPGCLPEFTNGDLLEPRLRGFSTALVFARTLPHFYQPTLEPARELLQRFAKRSALNATILLSIYTDETGEQHGNATHHKLADLAAAAFSAGLRWLDHDRAQGYLNVKLERGEIQP